jgi:hypothetical protein
MFTGIVEGSAEENEKAKEAGICRKLCDIVADSEDRRILAPTNGLDGSYESFVISLDATSPADLTLEYLVDRLLNEEACRGKTVEELLRRQSRFRVPFI